VLCGLVSPADDLASPRLVPPGTAGADLVLAVADGTPRNPLTRRRDPVRAAAGVLRRMVMNKFGVLFAVLLAIIVAGFALNFVRYSFTNAVYLTLMDLTGSALAGLAGSLIEDTEQDGQARVLARQVSGSGGLDWSPRRDYRLGPGDRLIVLATRKGLEPFLSAR
jgi:hypothetical protein